MFDKQYRFRGSHAEKVKQLTAAFESIKKTSVFARNVDVYVNAPLIGYLFGRIAEADNAKNPETGEVYNQNVMGDRVMYSSDDLLYNFRLIMLLDEEYEPDEEVRINKAFRVMGKDPKDMERFDSYVRGGVDVLYEKIIEGAGEAEDYVNRLFDFIADFYERFNETVDRGEILEACKQK